MKISPARELLLTVWKHAGGNTPHSWERLNHSMHTAMRLAIGSGMVFEKDDWDLDGFRAGYWVGEMESHYRLAVVVGNASAIETYEDWIGRKPLIADDVRIGRSYSDESSYTHGATSRQRERLAVGFSFTYSGETVEVTSFTAAGEAVCCSYKPRSEESWSRRKVLHRYTVTPESVKADRAERKERQRLIDVLTAAANADGAPKKLRGSIVAFLNVSRPEDFLTLPVKRLQTAVKKFAVND